MGQFVNKAYIFSFKVLNIEDIITTLDYGTTIIGVKNIYLKFFYINIRYGFG